MVGILIMDSGNLASLAFCARGGVLFRPATFQWDSLVRTADSPMTTHRRGKSHQNGPTPTRWRLGNPTTNPPTKTRRALIRKVDNVT